MLVHCLRLHLSLAAVAEKQQSSLHLSCMHINGRLPEHTNGREAKKLLKQVVCRLCLADLSNLGLKSHSGYEFPINS